MSRLSPIDKNFWTIHSETTPQVIASFFPLDAAPDFDALLRVIALRIEEFPRFRERVVRRRFGFGWKPDPSFSLANHVRLRPVPKAATIEDLRSDAELVFASPLDLSRPLWDFTVFTGGAMSGPAQAAAMFRVHHALADGLGALEFFHRLCEGEPDPQRRRNSSNSSVTKAPHVFGVNPIKSFFRLLHEGKQRPFPSAVNGADSPLRNVSTVDFALADLKLLRRRLGGSLNDIMLALVTGAVRRYQLMHAGPIDALKILLPFSLRRRANATALGNHLTGIGVLLPVGLPNPLDRLASIRSTINRVKSDGSFGAYRLLGTVNAYLPERLRRRIGAAAARRANFICTNMPGPEQPITLAGARILGNYGCAALMLEQGIAFAFISYAGKMCVSVVSDPGIVPDGSKIIPLLQDSYAELRALAEAPAENIAAAL